ncbi:MAG: porin family protein, partial [Methylocystis sp.]|nr:porin family protein [Methylocystis sp.]
MGRSTALILAAAFAAAASPTAFAADLLPPPPPIEAPPPPEFGGWYLRGDVGVGINQLNDFRRTLAPFNGLGGPAPTDVVLNFASLGDSAFAGAGAGFQFNNWLRADVTGEFRTEATFRDTESVHAFCPTSICLDHETAGLATALFLANGFVDLGTWFDVTPFVGGGVGLAHHWFAALTDISAGFPGSAGGLAAATTRTNFAWAVMAGLDFNVTPRLKLELGWRFVDMGRVQSNPIVCTSIP